MNSHKAVLQLLGLAKRAGQLELGTGAVLEAIRNQSAQLVFFPADGGASQAKKFSDKATFYQVPVNTAFTKAELATAIGQNRAVLAVLDRGFAKKIKQVLEEKERN
ncbi:ribosomal L7Ae/L30e/S12e/Gadd45 family protein [Leuconostocaceae bacterium ESL0958]|nr:ribosomal L7Ae/L30e/S12e/Gadd45 family protein [Leuconostocaceae bacterium ESL0958]